jgi:hypothetical protein
MIERTLSRATTALQLLPTSPLRQLSGQGAPDAATGTIANKVTSSS